MACGEHGGRVLEDALEAGLPCLSHFLPASLFGLTLFLELLLALFFLAPPLFLIFLSALRVLAFALCGLFLGFFFLRGRHDGGGAVRMFGCGLWIMHRAVEVSANGEGGADALAVDDEGGLGGSQDRAGSASGFLMTVFDLSYVGKLDGSGSLLFGTAPTVLDLYEVGTGGDLAVVVRLNLAVTAGASMHHVESGQTASLSCWLAAAAPTAWVSRPRSGLLRPEMSGRIPISSEELL